MIKRLLLLPMPPILRPAEQSDHAALAQFTSSMNYIHRHLDWRDTFEWLGRQPFWILEDNQEILATLAFPPEPEEVAWVRLFAVSMHTSPDRAWHKLFERAYADLRERTPTPPVVSLALREWYEGLLIRNGFNYHQDIVVFLFDEEPPYPPKLDPSIRLRDMLPDELDKVRAVDALAFEPIWRLSKDDLRYAAAKSSYCTVAEFDGEIIGYTMSSSSGMYAHLARLAVHPEYQHQRLGYALVQDLLHYFISKNNYWGVTLNTQSTNTASLALYQKIGFRQTGERFPVFGYP